MSNLSDIVAGGGANEGNKNLIINGGFDFWQRATSQSTGGYGSFDRWRVEVGTSSQTTSRQNFTTGQTEVEGNPFYYASSIVSSVANANSFATITTKIENVSTLNGQKAILSFYAKADASKNIAIEFVQNFGTGGSPSSAINAIGVTTISLTANWQKHTVTVDLPSISGKTLGSDNNDYLQIYFWFDAGSNFDSRTNSLGQQSGTFDIAQVKLEEGSQDSKFRRAGDTYAGELALCQRYYLRINSRPDSVGSNKPSAYDACCVSTTRALGTLDFSSQMRDYPTYSFSALSDFRISGITPTSMALRSSTLLSGQLDIFVASGLVNQAAEQVEFVNENGFIAFDSEL